MRNAFVVLVSLCIGLASGFIVPTGGLELIGEDRAILGENNGKDSEENKRDTLQDEIDTGFIVLPFRTINNNQIDLETNQNRIKDKELYDQHSTKQNNVNERSFIYINQKYKTPVVNQLYSSTDLLKETYKPVIANVEDKRKNYPLLKVKTEYFEPSLRPKQATVASYFPPVQYPQDTPKSMVVNDDKKEFNMNQQGTKVEGKHEFVELLKPPLLRPHITPNYNGRDPLKWTVPETQSGNYAALNTKKYKTSSPVDANKVPVTYDNYGFPTPYGYQRSIPKYSYTSDDLSLASDMNIRKLINDNNNDEVKKLFDNYLKDSLEEQVTNERINAKNNCSYSDCILKSRKQYIHSRVNNGPECRCGRKLNVKRIRNEESNGFANKDFSTRETTDSPEVVFSTEAYVTSRSSEMNDYSDMLTEEMNLKKLIEE